MTNSDELSQSINNQFATKIQELETLKDFFTTQRLDNKILSQNILHSYMSVTSILENFSNYLTKYLIHHRGFVIKHHYEQYSAEISKECAELIAGFYKEMGDLYQDAMLSKNYDYSFWKYHNGDAATRDNYEKKYMEIRDRFKELCTLEFKISSELRSEVDNFKSNMENKDEHLLTIEPDVEYKNLETFSVEELADHLQKNCADGKLANVKALMADRRAVITLRNKNNQTLLHYVCSSYSENIELLFFLLTQLGEAAKTEVMVADKNGFLALHIAAANGHTTMCGLLLQYVPELQVNKINARDATPLHYAANPKIAQMLIAYGANPKIKNKYDLTPLLEASIFQRSDVMEYLMETGVVVDLDNSEGFSRALDIAALNGNMKIAELLIKSAADLVVKIALNLGLSENLIKNPTAKEDKASVQKILDYLAHTQKKLLYKSIFIEKVKTDIIKAESGNSEKAQQLKNSFEKVLTKINEKIFDEKCSLDDLKTWVYTYKSNDMSINLEKAIEQSLATEPTSSYWDSYASSLPDSFYYGI